MRKHLGALLGLFAVSLAVPSAEAQTIGPFSWQTQPYCNAVSITLVQVGAHYQLIGTDNLCGAGTAPLTGTAVLAGGSAVFGFTVALPSGKSAHLTASIDLATISGSWSDADGNTGTFAFGGSAGGATRPEPAAASSITVAQFSPAVYAGPGSAATVSRSDHDHDSRYYTKAQSDARVVLAGFSSSVTTHDITAPVAVRSVTITAPGAGTLVATGVTSIIDGTAAEYSCSVGTSGGYELDHAQFVNLATPVATITTVRHLPVSAGAHTVAMFCDTTGAGSGLAVRPKLSVLFVPN